MRVFPSAAKASPNLAMAATPEVLERDDPRSQARTSAVREPANTDSAGRAPDLDARTRDEGATFPCPRIDRRPAGRGAMADLGSSSGTAARSSGPGQPARGPVRTAGLEPPGHQVGAEAGHGRSRYGLEPGVRDGPATSPGDRGRYQALGAGVRIDLPPCAGGSGDLCSRPGRRQRSGDLTRVGGRHARFLDG